MIKLTGAKLHHAMEVLPALTKLPMLTSALMPPVANAKLVTIMKLVPLIVWHVP